MFFVNGPLSDDLHILMNIKDPTEKSPQVGDKKAPREKKTAHKKEATRYGMATRQLEGLLGRIASDMQQNLPVASMRQHGIQQQYRHMADKILAIQILLTSLQEAAKLATGEIVD